MRMEYPHGFPLPKLPSKGEGVSLSKLFNFIFGCIFLNIK